jgi:predicted AAA+ superfamily ATPase
MAGTIPARSDEAEAVYTRRLIDDELDELLEGLPAIAVEGPRAVGKTATALQRAKTVYPLDDGAVLAIVQADPGRLTRGDMPILIDEWQRFPESFDRVRRAVDAGAAASSFLLTGSATPKDPPTHSGAGRIVRVRLRPMTLAERGTSRPTVSLRRLLGGSRGAVAGSTQTRLDDYVHEIVRSGLPGLLPLGGRLLRARLDGYLDGIVDHDFEELGQTVRRPQLLRRWMAAYAAATSTVASYEKIRDAAEGGSERPPSRSTAQAYRDALERLFILDPVPAWLPTTNRLTQLASPPKHHLADPAFAARLLDVSATALLAGKQGNPGIRREGTLLGALFESLVTQSVRVYAQVAEARVSHLRTHRGDHEIDLIVERDGGVLAIEVKLTQVPAERDVQHLRWLEEQLGDQILDSVIITTGPEAYRRPDGIAVIPAALLGP